MLLISMWPLCEKTVFRIQWKVAVEIFTSVHRSSGKKQRSPLGKTVFSIGKKQGFTLGKSGIFHWGKAVFSIGKEAVLSIGKKVVFSIRNSNVLHLKENVFSIGEQQCSPLEKSSVLHWKKNYCFPLETVFSIEKKATFSIEKNPSVLH